MLTNDGLLHTSNAGSVPPRSGDCFPDGSGYSALVHGHHEIHPNRAIRASRHIDFLPPNNPFHGSGSVAHDLLGPGFTAHDRLGESGDPCAASVSGHSPSAKPCLRHRPLGYRVGTVSPDFTNPHKSLPILRGHVGYNLDFVERPVSTAARCV